MTYDATASQITFIVLLVVWELIWKGIALWVAAQRNQRNWYIAILIINSAGILPIIYLFTARPHDTETDDDYKTKATTRSVHA